MLQAKNLIITDAFHKLQISNKIGKIL